MPAPPTDAPTREFKPEWDDPAADPLGPPETTFWQKYNQHLEFPTSVLVSVLTLALGFMFVVLVVWAAMSGPDTNPIPIRLGEGGPDDFGDGSPNDGGTPEPISLGQSSLTPEQLEKQLNLPRDQLPQLKEEMQKMIPVEDPSANIPLTDKEAGPLTLLDEELRRKMLGQNRGKAGPNSGDTGPGDGPGGTGVDSTRARSIRWVLRFRTASGRDYLDQLMALKAVVMVPAKGTNKQMYIFRDLANPRPGTIATDPDIAQLSRQIQFSDMRKESVDQVAQALGLDYDPKVFWAFFPPELEKEMSRLEKSYRNRQPESIEETVFQVTVRAGQYQLVVVEQRVKP